MHVTKMSHVALIAHPETPLSDQVVAQFQALSTQRLKGEPLPYLLGEQEFFGRTFQLSPSVLIPRPDTETLVEWIVAHAPTAPKILDLGTGSGCIAITLALEIPHSRLTATDLSSSALKVARTNAQRLGADIQFLQGNWLEALDKDGSFDVIVSNPPYIDSQDPHLENLTHEPLSALTDGADGLNCIRTIVKQIQNRRLALKPCLIAIEHGWNQGKEVREIFQLSNLQDIETHKDYGNNERFTTAKLTPT